jgi:excisionase family DNA binding protein
MDGDFFCCNDLEVIYMTSTSKKDRLSLEDMPDIMTVDDLARFMGIGKFAAYEAIRRKQIPALVIGRKKIRIPKAALLAALMQLA